ncbi:MAG: antibiotic resistance protein VanZ [Paenibacillus sp.]|uniref:VanZ family protein n=1 Tax=Paenibacillus sp. GCM10012303 TaxID=3317340 RepID=UPI0029E15759|nr:antibiotic resistance protein VanZ [Paenibacillus sp.]
MSHIHRYLQQLSSKLDCDLSTKQELIEEFQDHLMLLKREYTEKGLADDLAEKCAVFDFGDSKLLQHKMEMELNPFKKIFRVSLWLSLCVYIWFLVMVLFVGKFDRMIDKDYGTVTLRFQWGDYPSNLIPFKNIDREIYQSIFWVSTRNAFDITFFKTAIGVSLLFIPLGFFLAIIFKVSTLTQFVIYTLIISMFIELVQFITNTGALNVNDILFYVSGSFIGWLVYSYFQKGKVSRLGNIAA